MSFSWTAKRSHTYLKEWWGYPDRHDLIKQPQHLSHGRNCVLIRRCIKKAWRTSQTTVFLWVYWNWRAYIMFHRWVTVITDYYSTKLWLLLMHKCIYKRYSWCLLVHFHVLYLTMQWLNKHPLSRGLSDFCRSVICAVVTFAEPSWDPSGLPAATFGELSEWNCFYFWKKKKQLHCFFVPSRMTFVRENRGCGFSSSPSISSMLKPNTSSSGETEVCVCVC